MPFLRNFRPGESCAYAGYPKEFELKERQSDWECGFECANFTVLAAMRTTISKEILNHVAGRRGYNDIEGLLESFIKYLDIPEEQKEQFSERDKLHEFNNFVKKVLREKDNMNF